MTEDEERALRAKLGAIQAADAAWNKRALDAEHKKVTHPTMLPPPVWTVEELPEADQARKDDWRNLPLWPWVDASAWVALRDPGAMSLLSACRSMFRKKPNVGELDAERLCHAVLKGLAKLPLLDDADRQLRGWCHAGLIPVDGSGARVVLPDHRPPYEAMLSAADIQRLALPVSIASPVEADAPVRVAPVEREAEGKRVAALLDDARMSVRDVRQSHINERWDTKCGKPLAVTTVTGWMLGKGKAGRPPKSV